MSCKTPTKKKKKTDGIDAGFKIVGRCFLRTRLFELTDSLNVNMFVYNETPQSSFNVLTSGAEFGQLVLVWICFM